MFHRPAFGMALLALTLQAQEFSADVLTAQPDGKGQKGKIYHTPDKDRYDSFVEQAAGLTPTRMITDREHKLMYLVEPKEKVILVNHALESAPKNPPDKSCMDLANILGPTFAGQGATGCKQLGAETIRGRSTVKWEVTLKLGPNQTGTSTLWVDPQLKWVVKFHYPNGEAGELQNIQVGPQPASLFALPADYRKQDLPH
jgi:hypothetical protein